jgi:hypothetical protein
VPLYEKQQHSQVVSLMTVLLWVCRVSSRIFNFEVSYSTRLDWARCDVFMR